MSTPVTFGEVLEAPEELKQGRRKPTTVDELMDEVLA